MTNLKFPVPFIKFTEIYTLVSYVYYPQNVDLLSNKQTADRALTWQ